MRALRSLIAFAMITGGTLLCPSPTPNRTTLPLRAEVSPGQLLHVERVFITHHKGYSMLRLHCRWLQDNLSALYKPRATLATPGHDEPSWHTLLPLSVNGPPGFPVVFDIRNPPHEFSELPVVVSFPRREPYLAPELKPLEFTIPVSAIDFPLVWPPQSEERAALPPVPKAKDGMTFLMVASVLMALVLAFAGLLTLTFRRTVVMRC
jgi:hypothetical protein